MPSPRRYFQLTGLNPNTQKPLHISAEAIWRHYSSNGQMELVLGIVRNGTSYLLATTNEFRYERPVERRLVEFESLSPIRFGSDSPVKSEGIPQDFKELYDGMEPQYVSRKNKKGWKDGKLNHPYGLANQTAGEPRSAYELSRVFYLASSGYPELSKLGVPAPNWRFNVKLVALSVNRWSLDSNVESHGEILDVGWVEFAENDATLRPWLESREDVSVHLKRNAKMTKPGETPVDFEHGETELLDKDGIHERVRQLLSTNSTSPLVLLVIGKQPTKVFFENCGVDTSQWSWDLQKLLRQTNRRYEEEQSGSHVSSYRSGRSGENQASQQRYRPSHRSRSPSPRADQHSRTRLNQHRPSSPVEHKPETASAHVYAIDVRELFQQVVDEVRQRDLFDIAAELGFGDIKRDEWCAGNECRILFTMWEFLASGPSVDQQKALLKCRQESRARNGQPVSQPLLPEAVHETKADPSEEDHDEFNYDPNSQRPVLQAPKGNSMMDQLWDGDDDYGEDYRD